MSTASDALEAVGRPAGLLWLEIDTTPDDPPEPLVARWSAVLSTAERERAAAFHHDRDRWTYLASHHRLRTVLGHCSGRAPESLEFVAAPCPTCGEPHGRPELAGLPTLRFSLSHSHSRFAVAAATVAVGIDVEELDSIPYGKDLDALIAGLHPAEVSELGSLPEPERRAGLLTCWTRKEAWLKGRGVGLAEGLDTTAVGVGEVRQPSGWQIIDVPTTTADHGCALALAISA